MSPIAILLVMLAAAAVITNAFRISCDLKPARRGFIGRIETWRDDGSADAVWWLLGMPVARSSWSHSTHLED